VNGVCADCNGCSDEKFNIEEWVSFAPINIADVDSFIGIANMP
jgi:hypothetical protein